MRPNNILVFNAADASADQTQAAPAPAAFVAAASVTGVLTGSSTGTIKVQASNDKPGPMMPQNWVDIPNATATLSAAGTFIIPEFSVCYEWLQVVYSKTNGLAGTITANLKTYGYSAT